MRGSHTCLVICQILMFTVGSPYLLGGLQTRHWPQEQKTQEVTLALPGQVMPAMPKLLLCQAHGIKLKGSVLGLVDPVSVHCDFLRQQIWTATSISVWQHVKLSKQICLLRYILCVAQTLSNCETTTTTPQLSWLMSKLWSVYCLEITVPVGWALNTNN